MVLRVFQVLGLGARIAYANRRAVVYAFVFIAGFALLYWLMGLEKHFDVPEYIEKDKRNSFANSIYTSVMAQSNAMPDVTPKTTVARMLFMAQVCTGWMWFLLFSNAFETA
jgi:hypothetical protein